MRAILSAVCALVLWAGESYAQETLASQPLPEVTEAISEPVVLSQGDKRWKDARLGNATVGEVGCLFMSITMILMEKQLVDDPRELAAFFTRQGLVTRSGSMLMGRLGTFFPDLVLLDRQLIQQWFAATRVQFWLMQGASVVLRLSTKHTRQHWVRVLGVEGGSIIVADSNGGKTDRLERLYGPNAIKEMVVFSG